MLEIGLNLNWIDDEWIQFTLPRLDLLVVFFAVGHLQTFLAKTVKFFLRFFVKLLKLITDKHTSAIFKDLGWAYFVLT